VLTAWNNLLNNLHGSGQSIANQAQNQGVVILSRIESYTQTESIYRMVNNGFRDILVMGRPYLDQWEAFLEAIEVGKANTISVLQQCDREVEENIILEAEEDLVRARSCVA